MIERSATVRNSAGIHCRPSALIVTAAIAYPGKIQVTCDEGDVDLRSLLALVSLGLSEGTPVRIRVWGPDEETVCQKMVELFERHFDFPPLRDDDDASLQTRL
jgi:phosphocarrier protein HPr